MAITKAVVMALPVVILVSIEFPSKLSRFPDDAVTNTCTKLLFIKSKNLINNGAQDE